MRRPARRSEHAVRRELRAPRAERAAPRGPAAEDARRFRLALAHGCPDAAAPRGGELSASASVSSRRLEVRGSREAARRFRTRRRPRARTSRVAATCEAALGFRADYPRSTSVCRERAWSSPTGANRSSSRAAARRARRSHRRLQARARLGAWRAPLGSVERVNATARERGCFRARRGRSAGSGRRSGSLRRTGLGTSAGRFRAETAGSRCRARTGPPLAKTRPRFDRAVARALAPVTCRGPCPSRVRFPSGAGCP